MADSPLRAAIESLGGALKDWTVMAPQPARRSRVVEYACGVASTERYCLV